MLALSLVVTLVVSQIVAVSPPRPHGYQVLHRQLFESAPFDAMFEEVHTAFSGGTAHPHLVLPHLLFSFVLLSPSALVGSDDVPHTSSMACRIHKANLEMNMFPNTLGI